jgi:hypothetical protein
MEVGEGVRAVRQEVVEGGRVVDAHHSVLISDSYVDYMMTLYRLRRPSGCPPDYT